MVLLAAYLLTGKELPKGVSTEFFEGDVKKDLENKENTQENFVDRSKAARPARAVKEAFVSFDVIDTSKITPMSGLWIAASIFVSIWSAFLAWCSAPVDENIIGRIFWTIFAFLFGEVYIFYHFFFHEGRGKCPRSYSYGTAYATAIDAKAKEAAMKMQTTIPTHGGKKLRKGKKH